jgi:putative nucleotidyltransferase with HDIG domain
MKIKELMTGNLRMADINDSYISVMESMQKNKIRHMPVVEDGFVKGMLSLRDLMNHYYENIERLLEETVAALSSAVEKRDPYTAGHQERVMQLSCAIAREMKLTDKQIGGIRMAAVIHDIGKLNIPIDYLTKPTKLSEAEMSVIKAHPKEGYEILQGIQFPWPIAEIVLQHHERMDGSGYPNGLSGEKILLEAKIIAVADVIEAMATNRPYRPMLGMEKALYEITSKKGIFFDPAVVDACVTILNRDKLFWKTE